MRYRCCACGTFSGLHYTLAGLPIPLPLLLPSIWNIFDICWFVPVPWRCWLFGVYGWLIFLRFGWTLERSSRAFVAYMDVEGMVRGVAQPRTRPTATPNRASALPHLPVPAINIAIIAATTHCRRSVSILHCWCTAFILPHRAYAAFPLGIYAADLPICRPSVAILLR
jgi:hypothetical protein